MLNALIMKNTDKTDVWLDCVDVMALLKVSRSCLRTLRRNGFLVAHRLPGGRKLLFRRSDVDDLLEKNAVFDGKIDKTAFLEGPR